MRKPILENGAIVIAASWESENTGIVLADFGGEYVTWFFNNDGCHWGRYFQQDFEGARQDFISRAWRFEKDGAWSHLNGK